MLETEPMAETGAACLALAWQHRDALGLQSGTGIPLVAPYGR